MSYENTSSRASDKVLGYVRSNWDLILAFALFAYLADVAAAYEGEPGQFPRFFLLLGLVFIGVELLSSLLPQRYQRVFDFFTTGVASSFEDDPVPTDGDQPDGEESAASEAAEEQYDSTEPEVENTGRKILLTAVYLVGFVGSSYLVGFLPSIPIYVALQLYTLGYKNVRYVLVSAIVLMVFVYVMFGMVLNVPIFEGELVGW